MADLQQRVVAFLEGRRAPELSDLIRRHNGVPLAAPCLREVHSPESPVLQQSIARVLQSSPDFVIFTTGVGTSTVFEAAQHMRREHDLLWALEGTTVIARGPKPAAVLRKLGVRIDMIAPPPNTTAEVLALLEHVDLTGKTVVVQLYGEPNPPLTESLKSRGAAVLELAPYVWDRPVDPQPILRLLDALDHHSVDALLVTSQAQVGNLFDVAHAAGRAANLHGVAIGAQGPVAEAALQRRGLHAAFVPGHGHMGALVLAAAEYLSTQGVTAQ